MIAAAALLVSDALGGSLRLAVGGLAMAAVLAGPAAYTVQTVATPSTGSSPTAGPTVAGADERGFGGGARPSGGFDGTPPSGAAPGGAPTGSGATSAQTGPTGGGDGGTADSAVVSLLEQDADSYRWVVTTTGSMSSAPYQLATQDPVMAIGGFAGQDDSPTLAQFQAYVQAGLIHYYIGGGGAGGGGGARGGQDGGDSSASQIAAWVAANYTAQTVGGVTVYDLTS